MSAVDNDSGRMSKIGDKNSAVIDMHVHAVPGELIKRLAAKDTDGLSVTKSEAGWNISFPGSSTPRLVRHPMVDLARRAVWAREKGITSQVISPWLDVQPTSAMPDRAARDWARRLNTALAEQEHGNQVLATVAMTKHSGEDLLKAIEHDGMAGLILSTNPPGVGDLGDRALEALWEAAAGLGVPVVLHPPTGGPMQALPDSKEFGNTFCRLVDTTLAVSKLLLAGVLDRHPNLRFIVVHGGGFLPYQSMRLDGGHRADALSHYILERDKPSDYAKDLFFDTVAMSAQSIRFLAAWAGAQRVLLGSDYPFPLGDQDPVGTVREADLGEGASTAVLGGNAARLFPAFLEPAHA
jgi:aminocarboxymuconate-semialdehyde decarboxylase